MLNFKMVLIALAALLLTGCGKQLPTYRYRLTVEVDTPAGLRTGSSVIEVRSNMGYSSMGPGSMTYIHVVGEAVAVDLPGGQTLFALLSKPDLPYPTQGAGKFALNALPTDLRMEDDTWYGKRLAELLTKRAPADLPPKDYPMLVRFRTITDPKSVEAVSRDEFAKSFGRGFALRRITVQMTDAPITRAIEKRLIWLGPYSEPRLDRDFVSAPYNETNLSQRLMMGDFIWRVSD